MGLRYSEALTSHLLEGVLNMQDSTTYQAILREGRKQGMIMARNEALIEGRIFEAQRLLLLVGEIRFGTPDEKTRSAFEADRDLDHLERMYVRILDTNLHDWEGLLGTP